jgi:hypothetical protein
MVAESLRSIAEAKSRLNSPDAEIERLRAT